MFTTKYSKNAQKPAAKPAAKKRVQKFADGGKVEKEFETIRDRDGAKTMIRKGTSPKDYYGVSPNAPVEKYSAGYYEKAKILGRAQASKSIADIDRDVWGDRQSEFRKGPRYQDND